MKRFCTIVLTLLTVYGTADAQSVAELVGRCIEHLKAGDSVAFRQTYPQLFMRYIAETSDVGMDNSIRRGDLSAVQAALDSLTTDPESDIEAYYYLSDSSYHHFLRGTSLRGKYDRWIDSVKSAPYAALRDEIWQMQRVDQGARILYLNRPKETPDSIWNKIRNEILLIDEQNTLRATQIIDSFGRWPGRDVLGYSADLTLWLCIQHADQRPEVALRYLPMLKAAVDERRTDPMHYAYLVDRIRMHEGREQVYGTQTYRAKTDDGGTFFFVIPIEDVDHVDERRAAMGMEPLAEYVESMNAHWDPVQYKKDLPKIWEYYKRLRSK